MSSASRPPGAAPANRTLQGPQQLELGTTVRSFTIRCRLPLAGLQQPYRGVHGSAAEALEAAGRAFLAAHRVTRCHLQVLQPPDADVYRAELKRGALRLLKVGTARPPDPSGQDEL